MDRLIGTGFAIGLNSLTGLEFRADKPFRACLICGDVFQSEEDRNPRNEDEVMMATIRRQEWANRHAKQHREMEHWMLKMSGRTMTPEAAHRLAAFGVIPIADMVLDNETESALSESKAIPVDDAEGR